MNDKLLIIVLTILATFLTIFLGIQGSRKPLPRLKFSENLKIYTIETDSLMHKNVKILFTYKGEIIPDVYINIYSNQFEFVVATNQQAKVLIK